ncbi:MAG: transposase [Planctomycetes bacterium]|nr:transposase [Planctomycetota bacterium]
MSRKPRIDEPGALHHIFNRGIARRVVFESAHAADLLLQIVAKAGERGEIALLAFAFLSTHFHLLVRSLKGNISYTMMRIESEFVRRYNMVHERDGPLFRSRFGSVRITSEEQRLNTLRYIDQNAVEAGLARRAEDYRLASAWHYGRDMLLPRMSYDWLLEDLLPYTVRGASLSDAYRQVFCRRSVTPDMKFVIEQRMNGKTRIDPIARVLFDESFARLNSRFRDANILSDGVDLEHAIIGPKSVLDAILESRASDPIWNVGHVKIDPWRLVHVGLLRSHCALSYDQIGGIVQLSASRAQRIARRHRTLMAERPAYASRVRPISERAIQLFVEREVF